jgi:hypothetical protein
MQEKNNIFALSDAKAAGTILQISAKTNQRLCGIWG